MTSVPWEYDVTSAAFFMRSRQYPITLSASIYFPQITEIPLIKNGLKHSYHTSYVCSGSLLVVSKTNKTLAYGRKTNVVWKSKWKRLETLVNGTFPKDTLVSIMYIFMNSYWTNLQITPFVRITSKVVVEKNNHKEWFWIECGKTKTKVTTVTNHKKRKRYNEPIRNWNRYMWPAPSAEKRVRVSHDWFWF